MDGVMSLRAILLPSVFLISSLFVLACSSDSNPEASLAATTAILGPRGP